MSSRTCRQCHRIDDKDEIVTNNDQTIRVNIENEEQEWTNKFIAEAQKKDQKPRRVLRFEERVHKKR